jgi:predicted transcriptional regulator
VEFEVECEEKRLEEVVGRLLSVVVARLKDSGLLTEMPAGGSVVARTETCRGVIQGLWEESFFVVSHDLGDVHAEMARRGFHYDRTAVAHALIDLVKEGILTREGKPRRYVYAQKRPPPAGVKEIRKQVSDTSKAVGGAADAMKPR